MSGNGLVQTVTAVEPQTEAWHVAVTTWESHGKPGARFPAFLEFVPVAGESMACVSCRLPGVKVLTVHFG